MIDTRGRGKVMNKTNCYAKHLKHPIASGSNLRLENRPFFNKFI